MNATPLLEKFSTKFMKTTLPQFSVGDTVDVVFRIQEGGKERKQTFQGTVIGVRGHGVNTMVAVRRIVQGEGVERTFPIHSPSVVTIRIVRKGKVRRAKLYYLRDRVGKATKVKERLWTLSEEEAALKTAKAAEAEDEAKAAQEALAHPKPKDEKGAKAKANKPAKKH